MSYKCKIFDDELEIDVLNKENVKRSSSDKFISIEDSSLVMDLVNKKVKGVKGILNLLS